MKRKLNHKISSLFTTNPPSHRSLVNMQTPHNIPFPFLVPPLPSLVSNTLYLPSYPLVQATNMHGKDCDMKMVAAVIHFFLQ